MIDSSRYCPKEISWLRFNHRVLQEASDTSLPLVERIKFLGIFSSNQDEFFRVRVATLKKIVEADKKKIDPLFGHRYYKVLKSIQDIALEQAELFNKAYDRLLKSFASEGIYILNEKEIDDKQRSFVREFFREEVRSELVPIMLDQAPRFPELTDQAVYFAITIQEKKNDEGQLALLEIPTHILSRFVRLPDKQGEVYIMLLDDVIRTCLDLVFPNLGKYRCEAYMLKISRDADMDIDDDLDESYLSKITDSLKRRRLGAPTRIVFDQAMPSRLQRYLLEALQVKEMDTLIPGGRYHNFKDFFGFPSLGRVDLIHPRFEHLDHPDFAHASSFFDVIAKKDVLLHYPYHKFDPVIDFMREAAVDSKVTSIQITLYRLAKNSRVINALVSAAKNGKRVQVVLELQARFDEKANVKWANYLREQGVEVHFGVEGIKIHSKLCLITRKEHGEAKLYAMLSTGNFNESTAKIYTDHMLMTTKVGITKEVSMVMDYINQPYQNRSFRSLLASPLTMRNRITRMVEKEISNAKAGKEAWISLKLNNLADRQVTDLLYSASRAGVKIRLVIRGMCSVIPGLPGVSENISAISIVDRFLEHSRFYIFANGGKPNVIVSSADWMTRNLDRRIEVGFPINDNKLKNQILKVFEHQWKDNVKARKVEDKGKNEIVKGGDEPFRSQEETYRYICALAKKSK